MSAIFFASVFSLLIPLQQKTSFRKVYDDNEESKLLTAMLMLWALISCAEIRAQEIQKVSNDSIALQEVVVKAARVVNKEDGKLIFPSDIQKQRSFSGFRF